MTSVQFRTTKVQHPTNLFSSSTTTPLPIPPTTVQLSPPLTPATYLEEWFLLEQLPQNTAAAPDVHGGPVPLLAQQKFRRPVPQRDHLVRVGTRLLRVEQASQTEIAELHLAPGGGEGEDGCEACEEFWVKVVL